METIQVKAKNTIKDEKVEDLVNSSSKVTDEKIEESLNYDLLTQEEKDAIDEFNKKLDLTDATELLQYGSTAQNKISEFSDSVLENVKTKNTGEAGKLLSELVAEIKSFDSSVGDTEKKGLFATFHSAKKQFDKLLAKYSKIETNIDTIEGGLEKDKLRLLKDISLFDTMYEKNLDFFKEISLYIIAGERKLNELRNEVLPKLKEQAQKSGEQLDVQKVQDMENTINRFEKKLYDLKTTRIISIQMAPQIRLLQNNDAELVEKIQNSITNTIPLWKNQIVLSLGIANAKHALKEQQAVTNLTNDMLKKNSETLKQGSIDIAKESERAIVDVETLKKTNKDLIDTLSEVIKIHEEGREKRQAAEKELANIEKELKEKLIEINVKPIESEK